MRCYVGLSKICDDNYSSFLLKYVCVLYYGHCVIFAAPGFYIDITISTCLVFCHDWASAIAQLVHPVSITILHLHSMYFPSMKLESHIFFSRE